MSAELRVGQGFDAHRFAEDDRPLVLGGIEIPGDGLLGHSDADVVTHAVCDALLGAADLDDLGTLFPDSDPQWSGARSMDLLAGVVDRVQRAGWRVANVDVALVAQSPRLAPYRAQMRTALTAAIGAPVNVKPKHPERLGALGRSEGMACWAVALLVAHEAVPAADEKGTVE